MPVLETVFGIFLAALISACAVVDTATGEKGEDTRSIRPGIMQVQVEAVLGTAVKEWISKDGIRYSVYEFDAGKPAAGDTAAAVAAADVLTMGIFELVLALPDSGPVVDRHTSRVVVSFDKDNTVLGLFDEFDELPPDGRSTKRPKVLDPGPPKEVGESSD